MIYQRARLIQRAIVLGTLSALFAAVLILTLFFAALMKWQLAALIGLFFVGCLLTLVMSLIAFIMDIRLSLNALRLELARPAEGDKHPPIL